jgi:hypothetical protein
MIAFIKYENLNAPGLASLKGTRLMVHALGQVLSMLLYLFYLWYLLCLDFLWVGPDLLLLYRYLHSSCDPV